jgi:hypothetical protein
MTQEEKRYAAIAAFNASRAQALAAYEAAMAQAWAAYKAALKAIEEEVSDARRD